MVAPAWGVGAFEGDQRIKLEAMTPRCRALALAISSDVVEAAAIPSFSEEGGWGIVLRRGDESPLLISKRQHNSPESALADLEAILVEHATLSVPILENSVEYHKKRAAAEVEQWERDLARLQAYVDALETKASETVR